jgi:subtilase-type serine protease
MKKTTKNTASASKRSKTKAAPKKAAAKRAASPPDETADAARSEGSGAAAAVAATRAAADITVAAAAAAQAAAEITKDARITLMDKAIEAAQAAVDAAAALEGSGDPHEAASASDLAIDARNDRDDLKVNRAFLNNRSTFRPLSDDSIRDLDDLARAIDARIRASAIVNATVAIATEVLSNATKIGQILDERA